jgi:hypothetical protein
MGTVRRLAPAAGDVTPGQAVNAYLVTLGGAEQVSTRRTYGWILRWIVTEFGSDTAPDIDPERFAAWFTAQWADRSPSRPAQVAAGKRAAAAGAEGPELQARPGQPPAAFRPRVGQYRGIAEVLSPPGPAELVHIGGDAVDDRPHPGKVNGHEGSVRPVGGRAQVDRWRVAVSVQVREPVRALPQPAHLIR